MLRNARGERPFLHERVLMGDELLDEKPVTIQKMPPILWIQGRTTPMCMLVMWFHLSLTMAIWVGMKMM